MANTTKTHIQHGCQTHLTRASESIIGSIDSDIKFVGREFYFNELENAFNRYKIFGVFGIRAVGKSRFITEFIKRIRKQHASLPELGRLETTHSFQHWTSMQFVKVNLRMHTGIESIYAAICSSLGITPNPTSPKLQIVQEITKRCEEAFLFLFDDAEDTVEDTNTSGFLSLVSALARHCGNVKVFITSTTLVNFATLGKTFFRIEMAPLPSTESALLLKHTAPSVDFGDTMETIIKLSEGLPLLILMIGAELSEERGHITPHQMVEMLANFKLEALSSDFYPPEKRAADVYKKFIDRLCEIYQDRFAVLGYIPGSFDTEEAKDILGQETEAIAKHGTLIPIRRRHMLMYDSDTGRFEIQGILRECLNVYFTIKDMPEIRDRYIKTFSRVMLEMGRQLSTRDYASALFRFSLEQPNLYKLLTEVLYSTEDNYHFFIKIATSCTAMIEKFMSGISDKFYDGCLKVVDSFGREMDKAAVYVAIGSLATNSKGDFPLGEENYHSAIKILQPLGKSLQLVTVFQKLGWNLHNQGRSYESLGFLQKSLDMSGTEHEVVSLQTLSYIGAVYNWIGNYDKAKSCLEAALKRRRKVLGEEHAVVAESLNNLGLLYDQIGQHEKAPDYYEHGLVLKKKNKTTVWATVWSVVNSLNNVANKYTVFGKFDDAKRHLDEAMEILDKTENPHKGAISLTYNSYGKMYRAMGDYKKSSEMFGVAVDMRREIMRDSIPYIWSTIHLANVLKSRKQFARVLFLVDNILKSKDAALKRMPHNDFVLKCLEIKADIYKRGKLPELYKQTVDDMENEMMRLREVYDDLSKDSKVDEIDQRLQELRLNL